MKYSGLGRCLSMYRQDSLHVIRLIGRAWRHLYSLRRANSSHGGDAHLQAFVSGPVRALRSRDMGTVQANGHKMLTEGERDYIMKTPKFASPVFVG